MDLLHYLKTFLIIIYVYECVCVCAHPQKPKEGVWVSHAGVVSCSVTSDVGAGSPTSGPSQEQQTLLTTEPSPSPLFIIKRTSGIIFHLLCFFYRKWHISVGHRHSSHVPLKTEHRLCASQDRWSMRNTFSLCITTQNEHSCNFPTRVLSHTAI